MVRFDRLNWRSAGADDPATPKRWSTLIVAFVLSLIVVGTAMLLGSFLALSLWALSGGNP